MRQNSRIYKSVLIALGLCVLGENAAFAQAERRLSLDEAIELSVKNSNQLKLSKAKILESSAARREAQEHRLPDFKITGSYMRLNQPTVDLKLKLGASQPNSGESNGAGATSSVKVEQAAYSMANLSLPVFAGFKIKNGIESAKFLEKATELDAEKDRDEVIQNTIEAYNNLYKAQEAVEIVKENLKQSRQRIADFSNLEKNGLLARNDLLKAQLQESNIELALLDAENNWKITYINMNLMLGLPQETQLKPETIALKTTADIAPFEKWEAEALQNRKDIAAMDMRSKAANAGVKAAKGEYYPSVALTGGYVAAHVPNLLTLTNAVNGGIGVSYSPSSLWKAGSKVSQAKARVQEVEVGQAQLNDAVRLQTAKAYQNYLSNQKKIEVYSKALEQANENYRIVKNKQANSLATTTELLEADVAQLQAKLNYAFAKSDAMVSYNKLLQTAGLLNTQNNN